MTFTTHTVPRSQFGNNPELLDLHDATIDGLMVGQREITLRFSKVSVFFATDQAEEFDVRRGRVEIDCGGMEGLVVQFEPGEEFWVSDAVLLVDGASVERPLEPRDAPGSSLKLVTTRGGRIEFSCERVAVRVVELGPVVEHWSGPLVSDGE